MNRLMELLKTNFMYVITIVELIISIVCMLNKLYYIAIAFFVIIFLTIGLTIWGLNKNRKNKNRITYIDDAPVELLLLEEENRTQMSSVCLHEAMHKVEIKDKDMSVLWTYKGVCVAKEGESYFHFNIGGESPCSFEELNCYGFDLNRDPNRTEPIIPILKSADGLCKKVVLPFKKRLKQFDTFSIEFSYTWPNCMKYGKDFYISSLSFQNKNIKKYVVILEFVDIKPDWVRVYLENGRLLKTLSLTEYKNGSFVYKDIVENPSACSNLIYQFHRK